MRPNNSVLTGGGARAAERRILRTFGHHRYAVSNNNNVVLSGLPAAEPPATIYTARAGTRVRGTNPVSPDLWHELYRHTLNTARRIYYQSGCVNASGVSGLFTRRPTRTILA